MTYRPSTYLWPLLLVAFVLLGLPGCAPPQTTGLRTPLAPVPSASTEPTLANLPAVVVPLYIHEMPAVLTEATQPLPQLSSVGPLLRRANARFEAGKRMYRAGQVDAARREFDRAVEALLAGPQTGPDGEALDRKLSELAGDIYQYDISGLGAGRPEEEEVVYDKSPIEEIPEPTFPIDPKLRNQVTEELKTAVSQLPLEMNDEVLRYINYFSTARGRKTLESGLKRSGRYGTLIHRIFDEEGIPQEIIHLAQAESGFAPRAVSRKKATGMWQFIKSRGNEYGLKQTKTTDDRLDPEMATRAAARHLRDLYTEFGDWYLAMAAYNAGPLNVEKAVARTGYADFWELRRRNVLPKETASYVPIILAMTIMAKNPSHYGLKGIVPDPPLEYSTVKLDAATQLDLVADITEQPVSEIRALNPSLLANLAPAGYALHVPAGSSGSVVTALSLIPPANRATWRLHRVQDGDTLGEIARLYRTTPQRIESVNPACVDEITLGGLLIVPATPATVKKRTATRRAAAPRTGTAGKKAAKPVTAAAAKKPATGAAGAASAAKPKTGSPKTSPVASKRSGAAGSSSASAR